MTARLTHLSDDRGERAWFALNHRIAHRNMVKKQPRATSPPYFVDRMTQTNLRAGPWHLMHQLAHDNARSAGIPSTQILIDSDLANKSSASWWTLHNALEHRIALATKPAG